jgi:hypothetical protein
LHLLPALTPTKRSTQAVRSAQSTLLNKKDAIIKDFAPDKKVSYFSVLGSVGVAFCPQHPARPAG